MSEKQPTGHSDDLDHGQEGHHFPPVLMLGWLISVAWLVGYVIKNIGQSW